MATNKVRLHLPRFLKDGLSTEIVAAILAQCDTKTKLSAALVCKQWAEESRRSLLESVFRGRYDPDPPLPREPRYYGPATQIVDINKFEALLYKKPELRRHVRRISLMAFRDDWEITKRLVTLMKTFTRLHLVHIWPPFTHEIRDPAVPARTANSSQHPRSMVDLNDIHALFALPSIRQVDLDGLAWSNQMPENFRVQSVSPVKAVTAFTCLGMGNIGFREMFMWMKNLRSLRLVIDDDNGPYTPGGATISLPKILATAQPQAANLRNLVIEYPWNVPIIDEMAKRSLQAFSSLQSLDIPLELLHYSGFRAFADAYSDFVRDVGFQPNYPITDALPPNLRFLRIRVFNYMFRPAIGAKHPPFMWTDGPPGKIIEETQNSEAAQRKVFLGWLQGMLPHRTTNFPDLCDIEVSGGYCPLGQDEFYKWVQPVVHAFGNVGVRLKFDIPQKLPVSAMGLRPSRNPAAPNYR